jgi:antagonist of KipI
MGLRVLRAGVLTTIQDLGRFGLQRFGVQTCGPMDALAQRTANALLANDSRAASLEMTFDGPILFAEEAVVIALTGADLGARTGDVPLPRYRPLWLEANSELKFGAARRGARAYLAVRGGFAVPPIMGSASTDLRSHWGGLDGRALRRGDTLPIEDGRQKLPRSATAWKGSKGCAWAPWSARDPLDAQVLPLPVRFAAGRHWEEFSQDSRDQFLSQEFRVAGQSDRMGFRLQGAALQRVTNGDKLSEPVAAGSIQVPPDGQPIVLMADRQTVGGYPRIGEVASADLSRVAQLKPGDGIRFELTSETENEDLWLQQEAQFALLEAAARGWWNA